MKEIFTLKSLLMFVQLEIMAIMSVPGFDLIIICLINCWNILKKLKTVIAALWQ